MADQETGGAPAPEAPQKKELNPAFNILKKAGLFIAKAVWWILKVLMGAAFKKIEQAWEAKKLVLQHTYWMAMLLAAIYNPVTYMFNGAWANYTSLYGYATNVLFQNELGGSSTYVFAAVAVFVGGFTIWAVNNTLKSFGLFSSVMVIAVPSLLVMAVNAQFPTLQLLTGNLLQWVVLGVIAFYLGAGTAFSKLNRKWTGVIDNNQVSTSQDNDEADDSN